MAGEDTELCGFMDAKLPGGRCMSQRVKKRSLAPWKVWRRHWCSVRKLGPGLGIELLLDYGVGSNVGPASADKDNCIRIPANAIVCRTESRTKQFAFGVFPAKERKPLVYLAANSESESQRWMASLRQLLRPRRHRFMDGTFNVSMVDNAHSRSAGLTGLYGDLVASRTGIFVKDVHTGDIVETIDWKETSQFHLSSSGRPEDVKRVCVIHTTKAFRGGIGELHVFCLNAPRLLQDLVTQGRGPRHKHLAQRPLSLSEGDLRLAVQPGTDCSDRGLEVLKRKITTVNIVNNGLGLLLSTRSGSEAKLLGDIVVNNGTLEKMTSKMAMHKRAVDNVYQPEPAAINNVMSSLEELEEPSSRRVSNISVASGIYEEILDDFVAPRTRRVPSNLYEDPEELILNSSVKLQPPPLPPRQRRESGSVRNGSISDDGLDSEGGTRSATPNTQEDTTPTPEEKVSVSNRILEDTSDYVPMSPRLQDIALHELQQQAQQENLYMVMR
ncbi:PREDICTED: uncharacterized protein LOC105360468 [Ceratosolen solmsi marchali]|uniref:Uncharacterized protein LOC105360468 n=1 Tax=Ceratosolen solmsi marchali TaxID=326594 RepID=A0AAJ6YCZ3_9HYME|nr:PREDICTED: uncharacterized protein LOC105360468 [Ceratosolen solmsi marchali]